MIVLSDDKQISVVNASSGKVHSQWKRSGSSNSQDVDLSPDGKLVASIGTFEPKNEIGELHADIELHRADSKSLIITTGKGEWSGAGAFDVFAPVRCYDVATGNLIWDAKTFAFGKVNYMRPS